jgi:hypothetical protein
MVTQCEVRLAVLHASASTPQRRGKRPRRGEPGVRARRQDRSGRADVRRNFIDLLTPAELDLLATLNERILQHLATNYDSAEDEPPTTVGWNIGGDGRVLMRTDTGAADAQLRPSASGPAWTFEPKRLIQIQLMLQAIGVGVHLQAAAYSAGVR